MTSVVLKTEAQKTLVCDSMEISLTIKCEGLSMQASLHRLQECSDQLMASMENAGIDPNSFSLCDIDSAAQDNPPKQRAMAKLKVRGRFDHEQLCRLWQIITAASSRSKSLCPFPAIKPKRRLRRSKTKHCVWRQNGHPRWGHSLGKRTYPVVRLNLNAPKTVPVTAA